MTVLRHGGALPWDRSGNSFWLARYSEQSYSIFGACLSYSCSNILSGRVKLLGEIESWEVFVWICVYRVPILGL